MRAVVFWVLIILTIVITQSCSGDSPAPAVPEAGDFHQTAPEDGAKDVSVKTVFEWTPSLDAAEYTLTVSTSSTFADPMLEVKNLKENSFTTEVDLSAGTLYYWRVVALNLTGSKVATNSGLSFRTKTSPPEPSPGVSKYYVSPLGEDNPDKGTLSKPFKTLAYAATRVPASEGDTIFLKAGTYNETEPAIIPLGVNLIGEGESSTILSSSGVTLKDGVSSSDKNFKLWYDGSLIQLTSPNRKVFRNTSSAAIAPANGKQVISGFTIDGNSKALKAGVWVENRNNVEMSHVTIRNCNQRGAVFGCGAKDFYIYPTFYMTGIKIHDCTFLNSGKDLSDETLGNLCLAQLDGANITGIKIQDNQGYGIKFIYDGYFKNTSISNCDITVNESDSKWGEDIAIELWNLGPGNKIDNVKCNTWLSIVNHPEMFGTPNGTENMKISNITMIDKDGASSKEAIEVAAPGVEIFDSYFENKGIGMAVWDMGRSDITIRNNIFYNSSPLNNWASGAAVYIDNSRTWNFHNINVFNNVFDTHQTTVRIKGTNISEVKIQNNVFLNSVVADLQTEGTNISVTNNLKYATNEPTWLMTGTVSESNNITGLPGFNQTGARTTNYYKPTSAQSKVVDAGVNVGLDYNGSAPDIGRFEFPD